MTQVPGHPYVSYWTGQDQVGQFWIICQCTACNTEWKKPCSRPQLASSHILKFAELHGHGLRPMVQRR